MKYNNRKNQRRIRARERLERAIEQAIQDYEFLPRWVKRMKEEVRVLTERIVEKPGGFNAAQF